MSQFTKCNTYIAKSVSRWINIIHFMYTTLDLHNPQKRQITFKIAYIYIETANRSIQYVCTVHVLHNKYDTRVWMVAGSGRSPSPPSNYRTNRYSAQLNNSDV